MLSNELASQVAEACAVHGHRWQPRSGDRFVIPGREIDEVFVVSEMTIDVVNVPADRILQFNGTTEWALDSISADEVLWLPWEHQLRELIGLVGADFVALAKIAGVNEPTVDDRAGVDGAPNGAAPNDGATDASTWAVTLADGSRHTGPDAETAYARAVVGARAD